MNWKRLQQLARKISALRISVYAANATFFLLLSAFPAILLLLSVLQYTPLSQQDFLALLRGVVPSVLLPLLEFIVTDVFESGSWTILSVSAIAAVWSASRGVYGVVIGLNAIYQAKESRSYLALRLRCVFYTLLFLLALLLTLAAHVFGRKILAYFSSKDIPIFRFLAYLMRLRFLVVGLVLTLFFTVIFMVFPNRRTGFLASLPGAAGAAVAWIGFSAIFSVYTAKFGNYSAFYGSIAGIALTMLWLYACMCIVFYGGVFNRCLALYRARRSAREE